MGRATVRLVFSPLAAGGQRYDAGQGWPKTRGRVVKIRTGERVLWMPSNAIHRPQWAQDAPGPVTANGHFM